MDFGPKDIGPYNPYMDFSQENIGRTTQVQPSREKSDELVSKKSNVNGKVIFPKCPLNMFQQSKNHRISNYRENPNISFGMKNTYKKLLVCSV